MVIGGKVYVVWKCKMLGHDVTLHDVIGGHQEYIFIERQIEIWGIQVLHLAETTRAT